MSLLPEDECMLTTSNKIERKSCILQGAFKKDKVYGLPTLQHNQKGLVAFRPQQKEPQTGVIQFITQSSSNESGCCLIATAHLPLRRKDSKFVKFSLIDMISTPYKSTSLCEFMQQSLGKKGNICIKHSSKAILHTVSDRFDRLDCSSQSIQCF